MQPTSSLVQPTWCPWAQGVGYAQLASTQILEPAFSKGKPDRELSSKQALAVS